MKKTNEQQSVIIHLSIHLPFLTVFDEDGEEWNLEFSQVQEMHLQKIKIYHLIAIGNKDFIEQQLKTGGLNNAKNDTD